MADIITELFRDQETWNVQSKGTFKGLSQQPRIVKKRLGRTVLSQTKPVANNNDLCPCGSGVMYKKCCKLKSYAS